MIKSVATTMAVETKIARWRSDLMESTPKKRVAAARKLAEVDRDGTRATLLAMLDKAKTKTAKKTAAACLHFVADVPVARRIATDEKLELNPSVLSTAILATLYDDLRADLTKISAAVAERRIAKLDIFNSSARFERIDEDERERWETAYTDLLLAILDEAKLGTLHPRAARMIRDRDDARGWRGLIDRWEERPEVAHGFDVLACWLRREDHEQAPDALMRAACADIVERGDVSRDDDAGPQKNLDQRISKAVDRVPNRHLRTLVAALTSADMAPRWPAFSDAVATRFVEGQANVVAILDDPSLSLAHSHAALRAVLSEGDGARLVIERARRLDAPVVKHALRAIPQDDSFELLHRAITDEVARNESDLYQVLLDVPSALRDARWLDVARELPDAGRDLLIAMARDPKSPCRTSAVEQLAQEAKRVRGRMEKRAAVYALGQTGHPHATLFLVDALDDPDLADGAPLICTALAEVGDTRAIPILAKRQTGRYGPFLNQAIASIRARVSRIHADVLVAAAVDEDPVIADLARRAQEGDQDAAIVLEDALRERGRL